MVLKRSILLAKNYCAIEVEERETVPSLIKTSKPIMIGSRAKLPQELPNEQPLGCRIIIILPAMMGLLKSRWRRKNLIGAQAP